MICQSSTPSSAEGGNGVEGPPGELVLLGVQSSTDAGVGSRGLVFLFQPPHTCLQPPNVIPALSCYSLGCVESGNASNQASRRESRPGSILKEEGL